MGLKITCARERVKNGSWTPQIKGKIAIFREKFSSAIVSLEMTQSLIFFRVSRARDTELRREYQNSILLVREKLYG